MSSKCTGDAGLSVLPCGSAWVSTCCRFIELWQHSTSWVGNLLGCSHGSTLLLVQLSIDAVLWVHLCLMCFGGIDQKWFATHGKSWCKGLIQGEATWAGPWLLCECISFAD